MRTAILSVLLAACAADESPRPGHVYECNTEALTPSGLVEYCVADDEPAQLEYLSAQYEGCSPTRRHSGVCSYSCENYGKLTDLSGRGPCNAFLGCFCEPY